MRISANIGSMPSVTEPRTQTAERVAGAISNILNPFLMAMVAFILLAFKSRESVLSAARWSLVLGVINLAPILLIMAYLVRKGRLESMVTSMRQQRTELYLLTGAVTAIDYVVLRLINAPALLLAGLEIGLLGLMVFMCINFWWKISLHTAFATSLAVVAGILYGWIAAVAIIPLLLVGWARVELKEHTVAQAIAGVLLSGIIGLVGFRLFGVI